jgi:hypothetical protein
LNGKTGFGFEMDSVEGLADSLEKIYKLDEKALASMRTAGKELVFREHDKKAQFEKILKLIVDSAQRFKESDKPIAKQSTEKASSGLNTEKKAAETVDKKTEAAQVVTQEPAEEEKEETPKEKVDTEQPKQEEKTQQINEQPKMEETTDDPKTGNLLARPSGHKRAATELPID